ncbi:MAG: small multi-drug export protein [Candidatus Kerfeldbacteria bacterium]|nr:small multi-drug export protein [Candidatus Kerfeldbacteria bacterium]
MSEALATFFSGIPPALATVLIAMLPIAELRLALPIALTVYDLPFWSAYLLSLVGNMIPAVILLYALGPLSHRLSVHSSAMQRFFSWLLARTRRKSEHHFARYGQFLALATFVAIPLPVTGAWTGSVAAFLFGVSRRVSIPALVVGVAAAGIIVGAATVGLQRVF